MSFIDIFVLGIALSMDAFAVALCKGLKLKGDLNIKKCVHVGLWFGFFQALMPLVGYLLGVGFSEHIEKYDHFIAFGLLSVIGISMIKESFDKEDSCDNSSMKFKEMLLLAVATSIDALAVGVTFAFLHVNIIFAVIIIGVTTFIISSVAVKIGNIFGSKFKSGAEVFGGVTLILIGFKILVEHLGVL